MDATEMQRLLAPVDRLKVAAMLERQAQASHLRNFTYSLSAENKYTGSGAGVQDLAQSDISLSAEAPLDGDIYAFIEQSGISCPGVWHCNL